MKICLDMDGVLVDWSTGLCKLKNISPYTPEAQKILRAPEAIQGYKFGTLEEVDNAVIEAGYDFWMNLELLPWAHRLVDLCKQYKGLYFLTSPGPFHAGAHAKLDYIKKHFNSTDYILTKDKYLCAHPTHVLIDDMQKNIDLWKMAGGIPFHWPCQWKLREDPKLLETTFGDLEMLLSETIYAPMDFSS